MVYLWLGVFMFDVCVFSLTLRKTLELRKDTSNGIVTVVMRDGILYFGVVSLINFANIMAFALGKDYMKYLLASFANIYASTMVSRLMLNIRGEVPVVSSMTVLSSCELTSLDIGSLIENRMV